MMTAGDVFDLHGLAVFVAALRHQGAMAAGEAQAILGEARPHGAGREVAARLGQRLLDRLGGESAAGDAWYRYEISEIGYNFDVTAYGYGDEALARRWEMLCEKDNSVAYVTRLGTMEALAAGLLGEDPPGAPFPDLIARWEAHRARDAELQARNDAWRAAFRARHLARQA